MEPVFREEFLIPHAAVDRYDRLKTSWLLALAQEVAGDHFALLNADRESLAEKNLFWAVIRHRVQVERLPGPGQVIILETWPMPTTRVAYPRAIVACDREGNVLFRAVSLWVLMDRDTRAMVLPGKSGVEVTGLVRGTEIAAPGSLVPKPLENQSRRTVVYTELDTNGHVNNTRYLDWIDDLLPSSFHRDHDVREFTVCYNSEAVEGEELALRWQLLENDSLRVDAQRESAASGKPERVFSAQVVFG